MFILLHGQPWRPVNENGLIAKPIFGPDFPIWIGVAINLNREQNKAADWKTSLNGRFPFLDYKNRPFNQVRL